MDLLKGKVVADKIAEAVAEKAEAIKNKGVIPTIALVRIGERPDDISYERGAVKRAFDTGIMAKNYVFEENITQEQFLEEIEKLNKDPYIHGVLLFRPFPSHIDDTTVCQSLNPEKDMDGITPGSMAGVFMDRDLGHPPCTAEACMEVLKHYQIGLAGKKVTIFGRSLVIGKPVAMMAMKENATVTICHSKTSEKDAAEAGKNADIVIAALGKAKYINSLHVGENQIILDVGINVDENGKLCGDVNFDDVSEKAAAITPVPGGIGGVTTAVLMKHVVEAAEKACHA